MNERIILCAVLLPIIAALILMAVKPLKSNRNIRNAYVIFISAVTLLFAIMACFTKERIVLFSLFTNVDIAFRVDGLGRLFGVLTSIMWVISSVFQTEYLKHEKQEERYLFFFLSSLSALLGICFSANLITMYLFYEMMTLMTFPLVIHSLSKEAIQAALKYIFYSMGGAFLALSGVFYLNRFLSSYEFIEGGQLLATAGEHKEIILIVVFCMIVGFGSKAGMFPLHGWLPVAHPVAPAPASALMSGNVTKMGVLAILRVIYYIVGKDFLIGTWVQYAFLILALLTIVMGSMMAYKEAGLKKRLAYSSISQVSYALFGIALMNPIGLIGALMHVVYHSVVKNCLFLSAGAIIYKTGKTKVAQLKGIGKEMPLTMWCYTFASLTLIGIPPTSAFLSKWYLADGALNSSIHWVAVWGPILLIVSALLTAGYLFSITMDGFFPGNQYDYSSLVKKEPNLFMCIPLCLLATAAVILGMFPNGLLDFLTTLTTTLF